MKDAKGHGSEKRGGASPQDQRSAMGLPVRGTIRPEVFQGMKGPLGRSTVPTGPFEKMLLNMGMDNRTNPNGPHVAAGVDKSGTVVPVSVSDADAAKALAGGGAKSAAVPVHSGAAGRSDAPQHVIPPTPASGRTAQGSAAIHDSIGYGDRVTFRNRFGQERTGKAVMRGPAGWVLNMGGAHGTPAVPSADSITKVRKSRG